MLLNKPALEKINPEFGSSFTVKQYVLPTPNANEPFWHYHPELELVYVKGGNGKRHIGHHASYFRDGDLILIGSNLPHYGFTDRFTRNKSETIVQMKADFLGESFFKIPEMEAIQAMFDKARAGLVFFGDSKKRIGARLENLPKHDQFGRLIELLIILKEMALSTEYQILNANGYTLEVETQDNDRINVVYTYVQANFQSAIPLDEISEKVSMTVPAFCRYFKKLSGKTFTRFVNEYRVTHACKLLLEQNASITDVCFESGFNNFSHFNRFFKEITGKSPSEYRKSFKKIVE
ncbi:MAG: helix-turn-helix transcriptional regulator [Lewinellaceae bacterium]|nr:helix-turn-helix transcriptional regulator [Lewinellaceae bacterium]